MEQADQNLENCTTREQRYDEFVALLVRHDLAIRRFVRYLLPSRDGVDDVVQEAALECWKKFSDFQPPRTDAAGDEFVRWACVIARFKALSWQRYKARDRLVFRESVIEQLSNAASDALDRVDEQRRAVELCLEELPLEHRQLVLSVHTPGESIARLATETGEKARRLYSKVNALRGMLLDCVQRRLAEEVGNG